MPILVWDKIRRTGNLQLLYFKNQETYDLEYSKEVWNTIVNQYLKEFGLSEEASGILQTKKRIASNNIKYLLSGKKHHLTLGKVEQEKLKFMTSNSSDSSLNKSVASLSKFYGFKISFTDTTVREFYSLVKGASSG